MNKIRLIFLFLLIASISCFVSCSKQDTSMQVSEKVLMANVTLVMGDAYVLREDNPGKIKLKIGDRILPNDMIITGKSSGVNIVISDRGIIKIKDSSSVSLKNLIKVDSDNNVARVKVSAGRIVLGLQKLKKNSTFEVETPTAVAGVRGTSFMVSVDQKESSAFPYFVKVREKDNLVTKVAVLSGSVEFSNPKDAQDKRVISALREATLNNDDFKNLKIEKITRLSLDEISAIKDLSEIKQLKLKEISEELKKAEPSIQELMKSDLKTRSDIKSGQEDISTTEKSIEDQKIEAKKEAIKKMKATGKKSDNKYLEDGKGW